VTATCSSGSWLIQGPYHGPLTVNGSVIIDGDYQLDRTQLLVFWGLSSSLQINGKATISESLLLFMDQTSTDAIKKVTKTDKNSDEVRYISSYIWTGFIKPRDGGTDPINIAIYGRSSRACRSAIGTLSGASTSWNASFVIKDNCKLWWILLLAVGLPIALPAIITAIALACS
jgi:hypothetical protein